MTVMLFRILLIVASVMCASVPGWAQRMPPEGPKREAWFYEMSTGTDIINCQNIGYWMAATESQTRKFSNFEEIQKLASCVESARTNAERKYSAFREKLKSDSARVALKEHYISWLKTLDELQLQTGENEKAYSRRFEDNKRRMKDAWLRFEVENE